MNPAALKVHLKDVPKGGTIILNVDAFTDRNIARAGYEKTRSKTARWTTTS